MLDFKKAAMILRKKFQAKPILAVFCISGPYVLTTELTSQTILTEMRKNNGLKNSKQGHIFVFAPPFFLKGGICANAPLIKRNEKESLNYAPFRPKMGCFSPNYGPWQHNSPLTMLLHPKMLPTLLFGQYQNFPTSFHSLLPQYALLKTQILSADNR